MSLMREIMTNAHKAKRELGLTLSQALKGAWADARAKYAKKEEVKSMNEKISTIALDEGRWNGKIYGARKYNSCNIYLQDKKIELTNQEADILEEMKYQPIWARKSSEKAIDDSIEPVMISTFGKKSYRRQSFKKSAEKAYEDECLRAIGCIE